MQNSNRVEIHGCRCWAYQPYSVPFNENTLSNCPHQHFHLLVARETLMTVLSRWMLPTNVAECIAPLNNGKNVGSTAGKSSLSVSADCRCQYQRHKKAIFVLPRFYPLSHCHVCHLIFWLCYHTLDRVYSHCQHGFQKYEHPQCTLTFLTFYICKVCHRTKEIKL